MTTAAAQVPLNAQLASGMWRSREGCRRALRVRATRGPATSGLQLGSWNVRRFPQNTALEPSARTDTDIEWLACAIAWLDVDVLAVQEILSDGAGKTGQAQLLGALAQYSKRQYKLVLDECTAPALPHVGILYDAARVRLARKPSLRSLLLEAKDCSDNLHPGVAATVTATAVRPFLFIAVHLVADGDEAHFRQRQRQLAILKHELSLQRQREPSLPIVVTGDFNTTGCSKCSDDLDSAEETAQWASAFGKAKPPFELLRAQASCSAYFGREPVSLDHFLVTGDVPVVRNAQGRRTEVQGICALARCEELDEDGASAYEQRLSDHCPVLLKLHAESS